MEDPFGDAAEQQLAAAVIARLAPAEAPSLGVLWPPYRRRRRRYRRRPARLTGQGGGIAGGAGVTEQAELLLPYAMVATTVALDVLRGVAQDQVSAAVSGWLRRRRAPRTSVPMTRGLLLSIEAAIARDSPDWDLTDEQRDELLFGLRAALIAHFGVEDDPPGD